ncbi:MAG: alkaline phosphatase family protein, partial [Candidatus Nanohaloarchaea archaeon]|nr:alkaline phosphatase family protein [Candidatus Nanohaloarchaea archaeon]
MAGNVLVVAFDGMDKELIDKFDLDHVTQDEYGQIDNHTGVKEINTDELFASFITGETWEEHGVTGIKEWDSPILNRIEGVFPKRGALFTIGDMAKDGIKRFGGFERERYTREKIDCPTLFDRIDGSRALNIPAYDVTPGIEVFSWVLDKYGIEHAEREARKEFRQRKEEFWAAMDEPASPLFMVHFHYIDSINHLYGDVLHDEEKLEAAYAEMDRFAGEILDAAEDRYDTIIFMSDHGLPTATEHNENAFYSSNVE